MCATSFTAVYMTLVDHMNLLVLGDMFAFVPWPDENNDVSVVSSSQTSELPVIGQICHVVEKKKRCPAMVHATGMLVVHVHVHVHVHVLGSSICSYRN